MKNASKPQGSVSEFQYIILIHLMSTDNEQMNSIRHHQNTLQMNPREKTLVFLQIYLSVCHKANFTQNRAVFMSQA